MEAVLVDTFVEGVLNYLEHIPDIQASVGAPFLVESNNLELQDMTGIIKISGKYNGFVCFTAPRIFLSHLLAKQSIADRSEDNLLDMSGEIANTISGNARSTFGKEFQISPPIVIKENTIKSVEINRKRSLAVPISWNSYSPLLVVSLGELGQ